VGLRDELAGGAHACSSDGDRVTMLDRIWSAWVILRYAQPRYWWETLTNANER
jgi:hypothetical protein